MIPSDSNRTKLPSQETQYGSLNINKGVQKQLIYSRTPESTVLYDQDGGLNYRSTHHLSLGSDPLYIRL